MIAHPPCNYLSHVNEWLNNHNRYPDFMGKAAEAVQFFQDCLNANAPCVAVENPQPASFLKERLGPHSMIVEPFQFGERYRKRTYLWLKGLPPLLYTYINPSPEYFVNIRRGSKEYLRPLAPGHGQGPAYDSHSAHVSGPA